MDNIKLLTGTNTFQDWYNKTNEIVGRINNINGDLISVKDYGAKGDGIADEPPVIEDPPSWVKGLAPLVVGS